MKVEVEEISRGRRFLFAQTWAEMLETWKSDSSLFTQTLCDHPFRAVAWETPKLTQTNLEHPFECAVIDSPSLAQIRPNPKPFQAYFRPSAEVVTFPNLGQDALLVVPTPQGSREHYAHLATFLRHAPASQKQSFWESMAQAVEKRLGSRPVWISTAGLGVHWLHGRVCWTPKYYRYQKYC